MPIPARGSGPRRPIGTLQAAARRGPPLPWRRRPPQQRSDPLDYPHRPRRIQRPRLLLLLLPPPPRRSGCAQFSGACWVRALVRSSFVLHSFETVCHHKALEPARRAGAVRSNDSRHVPGHQARGSRIAPTSVCTELASPSSFSQSTAVWLYFTCSLPDLRGSQVWRRSSLLIVFLCI